MVGIYKIINPKKNIYIGQSTNIEKRWEMYKRLSCKSQLKLYNSLKKYGPENHIFEIIEECSVEQLDEREIYWGCYYNCLNRDCLNLKLGNGRGNVSEETKQKMSTSHKGKKLSKEIKEKISNSKKGMEYKLSEDKIHGNIGRKILWADKISISTKGRKGAFKNKSHTSETKKKMSDHRKQNYKNLDKTTPVIQYDMHGVFIKEWYSITEAKKKYKGDIQACCKKKQKTAAGFIWEYKNQ